MRWMFWTRDSQQLWWVDCRQRLGHADRASRLVGEGDLLDDLEALGPLHVVRVALGSQLEGHRAFGAVQGIGDELLGSLGAAARAVLARDDLDAEAVTLNVAGVAGLPTSGKTSGRSAATCSRSMTRLNSRPSASGTTQLAERLRPDLGVLEPDA